MIFQVDSMPSPAERITNSKAWRRVLVRVE
jgi:hypothetical protein